MRGKAKTTDESFQEDGITPAYAGKRPFQLMLARRFWDHPRLCGEKSRGVWISITISGSPPPMRGKEGEDYESQADDRITPAYAGKRTRSRGVLTSITGSPPPMRGKVTVVSPESVADRITPAYAGKSLHNACQIILFQDHPRLCGEKFVQHLQSHLYTGSPPPMRGKVSSFI